MGLIPPETIEQILSANDIVEVVGGYFPLKRSGPVFKALCPFHQERTPSFTVNPQRQIFKCFGCGAGGSALRFVMNYENLEFVAAVKKLAERAGIPLEENAMSAEDGARYSMRRRLLALHGEAAEFFHRQLMKETSAQTARAYLKSRGIDGEIAKAWKLGYAPDAWDAMRDFGYRESFSDEELLASGLVKEREDEDENSKAKNQNTRSFYDRFRGRVMFPICNDLGEVIAFSGRVLAADAKAAKYVNSPETMLFKKGEVLFGLHKSKRAIIRSGSAIVLEGQLDLITAFAAGVENVVAPQGTAFTERQARKLRQCFAEGLGEVALCFDADAAGEKAAERSLASLLAESLHVRVVEMPPGEDPDSLIRGQGAPAFVERVAAAKSFFDFQLDRLASRPNFATPTGKMQAARKMAESISLISDAVLRETVMNKVTIRLEVSLEAFARLLQQPKRPAAAAVENSTAASPALLDPTLRLLALVALHDAAGREWLLELEWEELLAGDSDAALLEKILAAEFDPRDRPSVQAFLTTLDAAEEAAVSGLLGEKVPAHPLAVAHDCCRELERRKIRRRMESIQARMRAPELAQTEVLALQKETLDLQKRLSDIARPLSPPL